MKVKTFRIPQYAPLFVLPLFLAVFVSSVSAVGMPGTAEGKPSSLPQLAQSRLADGPLKACQARENAIKTRSVHLEQLATTMEEKFDAIAGRVEEYYTTKVVPSGKTVPNYDSLVADIAASKTTVQTGLTKAQNDISSFSCTGSDPKGQMMTYRVDMQGVIQELKDYRTSIKDLIVAVRSVTGVTERTNSSSPSSLHPTNNQGGNQ